MASLSEDTLSLFIDSNKRLASEIRRRRPGIGSSDRAYAMIVSALRINHPEISDDKAEGAITDGHGDGEFDAIYVNGDVIEIYSCSDQDLGYNEAERLSNNVQKFILNNEPTNGLNQYVVEGIRKVVRKLNRGLSVKILICHKSIGITVKRPLNRLINSSNKIKIEYNSYSELARKWMNPERGYLLTWKINIPRDVRFEIKSHNNTIFLEALVRADKIAKLLNDYSNKKQDLFDKNVRGLQPQPYVSEGITETIRSSPKLLHVFHNGLVISCEHIDPRPAFYVIKNPQVVNGLQTTNALYELYKTRSKALLQRANVLCKFYASKDVKLIEQICQASNTQIKIDPSDLRSNDHIQMILEELFRLNNLKYIRKRTKGERGNIDKEDFAQWYYSCVNGEPADAKNKKSILFSVADNGVYKRIFNEDLNSKTVLNVFKIGKFIQQKVRGAQRKKEKKFMRNANLHLMAGIYYLGNNGSNLSAKYQKVKRVTKAVLLEQIRVYGEDYNKIFTKQKDTWSKIKDQI